MCPPGECTVISTWSAAEGTGQKREFDAWVADNIGLTYDTFTASVLLLQGKAEKLLDSKPEGRREVLDQVIPLNDQHLRRLGCEYIAYYHADRTHIALKEDDTGRPVEPLPTKPRQAVALLHIGGLHHRYILSTAA